ncbi:hypothetical protein FRC07_002431 [Ceratobasidium sp. 392]|nr:hypothetical protein FRC07_002431 [Ceratobasidium sp. 392]
MSSNHTLSGVEKELVHTITSLTENTEQDELMRQLRELMLLLNSPGHDATDLLACSQRILEYLNSSEEKYLNSEGSKELVRRLSAAMHNWAFRLGRNSKDKKGDSKNASQPSTNQSVKASKSADAPPNVPDESKSNLTRIKYSMSADTYRLLQDAQFLYRLSNMPEAALPPDQSILSIMRSNTLRTGSFEPASGHDTIEETVKRTYWDEMRVVLSDGGPKEQIDQLKALYHDLSEATSRFFPRTHPLYALFKCPLAPTTDPLGTAVQDMRLLAAGLRERCAPIRDDALIAVQQTLSDTLPASIINAAQAIAETAKFMREDLNDYVLQNASEEDAKHWVRAQARTKEREVALRISGTEEKLVQCWKDYLHVDTASVSWTLLARRLLETVSAPTAAIFLPPDTQIPSLPYQNIVPPQLMLSIESLVRVQDLIQAVVIVASLRSLVPISSDLAESFASRIWALVESVILGRSSSSEPQFKLINLQDEVIEAYHTSHTTHHSPHTPIADDTLRATVSRTLRAEDPVFRLLQKRLVSALEAELVQPASVGSVAPIVMRTGRDQEIRNTAASSHRAELPRIRAKGFDDHALDEPMVQLLDCIRRVLGWMVFCWNDFMSVT